ncbi:MAG: aldo/keto reductase [Bacteroidetes bacterium]|nr:aldo/keto reductase [Bacteroidota bacterium]MDA1122493.1 aldo/keto reductase [Bacteroidota bacterium]
MENKNQTDERLRFIRIGSTLAASAIFFPLSGNKVFGALNSNQNENSIPTVKLNNGIPMPMLGFGTNTLTGDIGERSVSEAISVGYRLIDTANIYGNEESVGAGIKKSGIKREELFVTSKLWVDNSGYEKAKKAYQTSLNKLGLEYLDLYLIHRTRGDVKGSWKAMEELYREGKIRAIGVSNFDSDQLSGLMAYAEIKPVINQIETHVFFQQNKLYDVLKEYEVQMESWSPFAASRNGIFNNPILADIGKKSNKSNAQVCLRWHYQRGVVTIPRSSKKAHMIENLDIFDFELTKKDMQTIAKLDLNITQFPEWE